MSLATVRVSSVQRRAGVLQGCLIALAVALLIAIIAGIWVARSWRGFVVGPMQAVVAAMLDSSDLPTDQRDRITARTDQFFQDFKDKDISLQEFGGVMEYLVDESSFVQALQLSGVEPAIKGLGMADEEEAAALRTVQRFTRGVVEGAIDTDVESLLAPIMTQTNADPNAPPEMAVKEDLTREDIDALLASMQTEVETAGVADEPYQVDYAALIDEAITAGIENAGGTVEPVDGDS